MKVGDYLTTDLEQDSFINMPMTHLSQIFYIKCKYLNENPSTFEIIYPKLERMFAKKGDVRSSLIVGSYLTIKLFIVLQLLALEFMQLQVYF